MNPRIEKVRNLIEKQGATFLGAGPMSLDCINVIIDLANEFSLPISLIPSRRQIECEELGGGYVENWSTEVFAKYVRNRDKGSFIILSRDHCGPWQIPSTNGINTLESEMKEVKISLQADLDSGFEIIHIDPSLGLKHGLSKSDIREIAYELIAFCESVKKNTVYYEIGTEEQDFNSADINESSEELRIILDFLDSKQLPKPLFFVQQTGTKVQELRNVGNFDHEIDAKGLLPASLQVPAILNVCRENGVWLKEHNADYISHESIAWHPRFGIHAANVAPEFGVAETKELIKIANDLELYDFLEIFRSKVLIEEKWKKWMLENSVASEEDKFLIAGHYHFSQPWFREWRIELYSLARNKGIDPQFRIENALKNSILRYLVPFGYSK